MPDRHGKHSAASMCLAARGCLLDKPNTAPILKIAPAHCLRPISAKKSRLPNLGSIPDAIAAQSGFARRWRSSDPRWQAAAALLLLAAVTSLAASPAVIAAEPALAAEKTVELVIDFGDGFEKRYPALPWKESQTVLDVLGQAKSHRHPISFKQQGSGGSAFLVAIDDVENEGGGSGAKNWTYKVNGKLANRSFAIRALEAGDVVLWKFGPRE